MTELQKLLQMEEARHAHEMSALKNRVAHQLQAEYSDFQDAQCMEMNIDLGENMRIQLENVFRILKKNGLL